MQLFTTLPLHLRTLNRMPANFTQSELDVVRKHYDNIAGLDGHGEYRDTTYAATSPQPPPPWVRVDGKMPQHVHGLPTRPQVTRELGNGDYLVEGMKFHMPGWWVVDFEVDAAAGPHDSVRFNLVLR